MKLGLVSDVKGGPSFCAGPCSLSASVQTSGGAKPLLYKETLLRNSYKIPLFLLAGSAE